MNILATGRRLATTAILVGLLAGPVAAQDIKTALTSLFTPAPTPAKVAAGGRISLSVQDQSLETVLGMLSEMSDVNFIANPSNLEARVTLTLTNVEWPTALSAILDMHNLQLVERQPNSQVYSIFPRQVAHAEPMEVATFQPTYASVSNLNNVFKAVVGKDGSVANIDSRNTAVVRTTASNLARIQKILDVVDHAQPQVFIEAKFIELDDQAIEDLGINWQSLEALSLQAANLGATYTRDRARDDTDTRVLNDESTKLFDKDGNQIQDEDISFIAIPNADPPQSIMKTTIESTRQLEDNTGVDDVASVSVADVMTAVLSASDFNVVLSALKKTDGVSVISNPKIIVASRESALIHIGETEKPFVSVVTPATETTAPVVTFNPGDPVDLGVRLEVTPTVNTASNITVHIQPELTRFVRNAIAPSGQTYPIIATKRIRTKFALESGKTVAIGGLTETTENDAVSKIPLLGDIPFLGKYLFSHTHKRKSQKETIIFVTVGLAQPASIDRHAGLPENSELTRRLLIQEEAVHSVVEEIEEPEIEELRADEIDEAIEPGE